MFITKYAAGLKEKLVSDAFSPIKYDAEKPKAVMDEDQIIGNRKLGIKAESIRITPASAAFAE